MKNYIFPLILLIFVSCSNNVTDSEKNDRVDYLTKGKWKVSEYDGEENKFSHGIVFSKDKQFFYLDSQGRIVPKNHEIIFELKSDTLKIVDFNFEQRFIFKKGTQVFVVKDLNKEKLELRSVYPDTTSTYKFRKEEL